MYTSYEQQTQFVSDTVSTVSTWPIVFAVMSLLASIFWFASAVCVLVFACGQLYQQGVEQNDEEIVKVAPRSNAQAGSNDLESPV